MFILKFQLVKVYCQGNQKFQVNKLIRWSTPKMLYVYHLFQSINLFKITLFKIQFTFIFKLQFVFIGNVFTELLKLCYGNSV